MSTGIRTYHSIGNKTFQNVGTTRTSSTTSNTTEATPRVPRPLGYTWAEPGAEVLLCEDSGYNPARNNPIRGTSHECSGVIHTLIHTAGGDPGARPVNVHWNNGTSNRYFFEDLEPHPSQYKRWVKNSSIKVEEKKEDVKKGPMFNKGDVVFLKPEFRRAGHEHPVLGTIFQSPGMIKGATHGKVKVNLTVEWYNGMQSEYTIRYDTEEEPCKCALINGEDGEQLKQFIIDNPNFAYRITKDIQQDNFGVYRFFRTILGIEDAPSEPEQSDKEPYRATYFGIDDEESLPDDGPDDEAEPDISFEEFEAQYVTFDFEAPPDIDRPSWMPSNEFLEEDQDGENPEGN